MTLQTEAEATVTEGYPSSECRTYTAGQDLIGQDRGGIRSAWENLAKLSKGLGLCSLIHAPSMH